MPVPGFLSSFADKAQSAINASPLAGHIPGTSNRPTSPDPATQPTANEAAGQGSKSHALEAISYQFRALQQQYSTTSPVQKIITIEKGGSIDFDNVSRDFKSQSKELYTWGQGEQDDLKDVTDRLAYLNFVQGSLANSLSTKLDSARAPLKALRDAETNLQPRRNIRAGIQTSIARFEHEQQKGNDKKVAELRDQLRKAESEDQHLENEVELLKRKAIRESEQIKWDAIREYGEKLVLLSQAASPIIAVLPTIPPTPNQPYAGHQTTGAVRASLQRALDNYKTGHINLPPQPAGADLSRSDTRSFGESHASELSSIHSDVSSSAVHSTQPPSAYKQPSGAATVAAAALATPPSVAKPLPAGLNTSHGSSVTSPAIDPHTLNQTPAPIPHTLSNTTPAPAAVSPTGAAVDPTKPANAPPAATPTIAETGMPVSAGPAGPGPASGSLHDIKAASADAGPRSGGLPGNAHAPEYGSPPVGGGPGGFIAPGARHETAEDEKKRLAAMYSQQQQVVPPSTSAGTTAAAQPPHHETAEEEKKRLEREERERILHSGNHPSGGPPGGDDLPPYQEPGAGL